jgi:hypothetical protein
MSFNRKSQAFLLDRNNITAFDSLRINGILFYNVIRIESFEYKKTYFLAPKIGFIQFINSIDTFTIKI